MRSDLPDRFAAFVAEHRLLVPGELVVVGVSGGMDSVVLLHLLQSEFEPVGVYVHHGLRPEADAEANSVEEFCRELGLAFELRRVALPTHGSRQSAARQLRYEALESVARERGAGRIAVAHHRDDVAETLLLQLCRGAGPRGWAAMPVSRPVRRGSDLTLIRPLRFAHRREIRTFAQGQGIRWLEDPSNCDSQYRRSALRSEVIPKLVELFGDGVMDRIATAAELAEAFRQSGAAMSSEAVLEEVVADGGRLRLAVLRSLPEPSRLGLYLEMLAVSDEHAPRTTAAAQAIDALLEAQPGRRLELGPVMVWRERDALLFAHGDLPARFVGTIAKPGRLRTPSGRLEIELTDTEDVRFTDDPTVEIVDADVLPRTLTVRTWRDGDRMRPLGLGGSKLVSDLLTDAQVPPSERGRTLVLADGERLLWLVGHRLDEALAVNPSTRHFARLLWRADGDGD